MRGVKKIIQHKPAMAIFMVAIITIVLLLENFLPFASHQSLAAVQNSISRTSTSDWEKGTTSGLLTGNDEIKLAHNDKHAWYSTGGTWGYRKKITVDKTKVASTDGAALTDFPVLVSLSSDSDLAANAQDDGDDILFTGADEKTKLSHEIESFDGTTGALVAWVKIPHINKGNDTFFYLYYGNASATSQQNKTDVWSNGYVGVWHMNQDPSGTAPQISNSVNSSYNWTTNGSMQSSQLVSGKNGQAISFDGTDDFLHNETTSAFNIDTQTIEAWANRTGASSQFNSLFTTFQSGYYGYRMYLDNTGLLYWAHAKSDGTYESASFGGSSSTGQWRNWVITKSGTTVTGYVNSSAYNKTLTDSSTRHVSSNDRVRAAFEGNNNAYFSGELDELRVSNIARSTDWITTQYNNQNSPDSFLSLGSQTAGTSLSIASDNISTAWYSTDWNYRRKITVDYSKVSSTQYDFPLLVKIADANDPVFANAQADGDDLLFTDAYGNKLSHEIETFDTTNKQLWAWVNAPCLSSTANTGFYLYYGNGSATSQQSVANVWIGNYKSVWHLKENPTASAPQFTDSTSNANAATSNGSQVSGDQQSAKINGGLNFDGSNDYLSAASPNLTTAATVEAWVKTDSGAKQEAVSLQSDSLVLRAHDDGNTGPTITAKIGGSYYTIGTSELTIGNWYHLVGVYSSGSLKLYLNGSQVNSTSASGTLDAGATNNIGVHQNGSANPFDGLMDEVRVSNLARSADWIATEYANQNAPGTFFSLGGQQGYYPTSTAASWYSSSWQYRQKVTVDHTKVAGDLTDFPLLISFSASTNPVFAEAQADGDDILFTSSDGITKLSHEIETFTPTSTTKNLAVWVKAPALSSTTDTVLYMYYGNSSATSQQNKTDVWSNGYIGVWHLPDGTTLAATDSTSNANNGTVTGATAATGKVDGAAYFGTDSSDIIEMSPTKIIDGTAATFDLWFNPSVSAPVGTAVEHRLFSKKYHDNGWIYNFSLNLYHGAVEGASNSYRIDYAYGDGSSGYGVLGNWYTFNPSNWYHIIITHDSSKVREYINGSLVTSSNVSSLIVGSTYNNWQDAPLDIGNGYGGVVTKGDIDNLEISSFARSASWVSTEYANQNSPADFYSVGQPENAAYYLSPSSIASGSGIIDTGWNLGWGTPSGFSANVTIPTNTSIVFYARSSAVGGSADSDWTSWQALGTATETGVFSVATASMPAGLLTGANKYLQTKAFPISDYGKYSSGTPVISDYTYYFSNDLEAPASPGTVSANIGGSSLTSDAWTNLSGTVNFIFSGASDVESGLAGYYIYFGADADADPSVYQAHSGAIGDNQNYSGSISSGSYYLRFKTADNAGNISSAATLFTVKCDLAKPANPSFISVSPEGYTTTNSYTFTWPAAADEGGSGIQYYEYKRGSDIAWSHTADAETRTLSGIEAYQQGANVFYVRSVDNAANIAADSVQVTYYWSGSAPPKPDNLTVTPSTSVENNFSISWNKPAVDTGDPPVVAYLYSINAAPTISNTVRVSSIDNVVTIGPDHFATQQGENTIYVVAEDQVGNKSFEPAFVASATFNCQTAAPPAPTAVSIADSSNRAINLWALTISWSPGVGYDASSFGYYQIQRSSDGFNFSDLATTTSLAYIDTQGISNEYTYTYRIIEVDNAGKESVASTEVSYQPRGNYLEPPEILNTPQVSVTSNTATISWSTDRAATSFVRYGTSQLQMNDSKGQIDLTQNHQVTLTGLSGSTLYYFQVQSADENRDYSLESAYSISYSFTTLAEPIVSKVSVSNITLSSADISFETTTVSQSKIEYGLTASYGGVIDDASAVAATSHQIKITGLKDSSQYHFKITSADVSGNLIISDDYSFETLPYPEISGAVVSEIEGASSQSLKIIWQTNVAATSIVKYSTSGIEQKESVKSKLETDHEIILSDLLDSSEYNFNIQSRDQFGNLAEAVINNFKTAEDTRPPQISDIIIETSNVGYDKAEKAQIVVGWRSDEPATSKVEYGTGYSGQYNNSTLEDKSLTKDHQVVISDLEPGAVLHLQVISTDKGGNTTVSTDNVAITGEGRKSILNLIINIINRLFGDVVRL